jgi:hypothetical protein
VRSRNYSDYPEIDSDDVFLESRFSRNTTNSTWSFRFNYDEQPVRTAERSDVDLNVDDPVEIPDDDTGFVNLQDDRKRLLFTPGWKYNFSDSTSMNVSLSYLDTTYAESLQLVLNDFTDTRLRISMDRAFSERTTGIILATARTYDIEDLATDTQGVGIQAGFERALSSTTSFRALVGIEDTESDISSVDPTFTADVSLRRRLETVNVLAQYRRTVNANGSGRLSVRDAVNLNLSRRLSEKVTAGLGVRAHQSNSLDEILTIDERDFIQLRSQFIWNLSSNFAAEFDYRYTFQKRSALPESANSNQIMLWLIYQPNSIDRRFAAGRL